MNNLPTAAESARQICPICGDPLRNGICTVPGCGSAAVPYEVWLRQIIDILWSEGWELSLLEPPPPLTTYHSAGFSPAQATARIFQNWKKPERQTKRIAKKIGKSFQRGNP